MISADGKGFYRRKRRQPGWRNIDRKKASDKEILTLARDS
jgi:hypothetical protein